MSQFNKKRSSIWLNFTPIAGKNKSKCDICGNEYSHAAGSTSNLSLHLRTKRPSVEVSSNKKPRLSVATTAASAGSDDSRVTPRSSQHISDQPNEPITSAARSIHDQSRDKHNGASRLSCVH